MDDQELQTFLLNVIAILLLFTAIQPPIYEETSLPLDRRLIPNFHGHGFYGRDEYAMISIKPALVVLEEHWRDTKFIPTAGNRLVANIAKTNSSWTGTNAPAPSSHQRC